MNFWHRLKTWEKHFEKAPKSQIWRTLTLFFFVAVVAGVLFSIQITNFQRQTVSMIEEDIKETEKTRMDRRLEMLKLTKYERKIEE